MKAQPDSAVNDSSPTGMVLNIMRFSVDDGPGLRTTLFLKGCPLACSWCHNPESQSTRPHVVWRAQRCINCGTCVAVCPEQAIHREGQAYVRMERHCRLCGRCTTSCYAEAWEVIGRTMSVDAVLAAVLRDRPFFEQSGGGVTISGGEPLAQPRFLAGLLTGLRTEGIHTALDTAGFAPYAEIERISPDVGLFLYDLKILDEQRHHRVTGVSNRQILANLRRLVQAGRPIVIRIPVVPGVNDDDDNIDRCGEFIASLNPAPVVELLPHHRTAEGKYALLQREYCAPAAPVSPGNLEQIARRLTRRGVHVRNGSLNRHE